ncbi:MAG: NAD-dependent epimerase/dehydratase family protein [Lachnospiraceae bacterium]|nr:NAD-dependent epimerase/dehydratase family protein [Lachnospiraceae bacterium]
MKKILLTGENSYIGTNLKAYLQEYNEKQGKECYLVDCISQRSDGWEMQDFGAYDTIVDVTGIAHVDVGKVSKEEITHYYDINWKLAVRTALKAREEGVRQFIYLSSSIVYGDSAVLGQEKHITKETKPTPANFYGDSKWQAEQELKSLGTKVFQVAILRLPFVYGAECKGNYRILSKLAEKMPAFPSVRNSRSMLYIENLNEFLRLIIEAGQGGLFFPQNPQHCSTGELVQAIGAAKGRKIYLWNILNPLVWLAAKCPGRIGKLTNKAFGSLTYDLELSKEPAGYQLYDLSESVHRIEQKGKA